MFYFLSKNVFLRYASISFF